MTAIFDKKTRAAIIARLVNKGYSRTQAYDILSIMIEECRV